MKVYLNVQRLRYAYTGKSFTDVVTRKDYARGPLFQVTNLNTDLTQFRPSKIQFQQSPTARNGSLDRRQPEMSRTYLKYALIVQKINFDKRGFHQITKLEILLMKSP